MRVVHKFPLVQAIEQIGHFIEIPNASKIVHVGRDPQEVPCVWAEIVTDASDVLVPSKPGKVGGLRVTVYGTGHRIPTALEHAGSFVAGPFVWHVYSQRVAAV